MKKLCTTLIIGSTLIFGCSALDSLGDASVRKKQLTSGDTVFVGTNISPTAVWNCKEVGTRQSYPWKNEQGNTLDVTTSSITESSEKKFEVSAIHYANVTNVKANYINLEIPEGKMLNTAGTKWNLRGHVQAFAVYYQCEKINPEHKISHLKGNTEWGFG